MGAQVSELPTSGGFMGPAFQMVTGPVRVASAGVVDPFPLAAAVDGVVEVTGAHTPVEARVVVPLYPPRDWFTDDAADQAPEHLTIYPTGRVAGVVAPAGRCLLDGSTRCWTVPRPADGRGSTLDGGADEDYQMARGAGEVFLADGSSIPVAPLPGEGGHANPYADAAVAADHYANTERQVARGRYVWSDRAGGIVFVGALVPTITEERLIVARGSASSIDFRWIDDEQRYRLVGCCNVNIAGLPTRYQAAVTAGASLVLPINPDPKEAPMGDTDTNETPACGCDPAGVKAASADDERKPTLDPDDDMAVREDSTVTAAAINPDDATADTQLAAKVDDIAAQTAEILAVVSDIQRALVQDAISDLDI